ncbi:hypothetical protein [Duncaniella freteri]|uniref:hypothetical protein n=2 Tax=Duncaniella freteri TaxID=2530391 RepID=UPI002573B0E9|nr:hypothetical protein [Duncaniella freteri]
MKKLLLLIAMTLYIAPSLLAAKNDVRIDLLKITRDALADPNIERDLLGSITATATYDPSTKVYTIHKFLGYKDTDGKDMVLKFTINEDAPVTSNINGIDKDAYGFTVYDQEPYYYTSANSFRTKVKLPLPENPNGTPDMSTTDFEPHMSQVFIGEDYECKLYGPIMWLSYNSSGAQIPRRSFVFKNENGSYTVYIELDCPIYRKLIDSEAWPENFYPEDPSQSDYHAYNLMFTVDPANLPEPGETAIENINIDTNDGPCEYFNLQGIKIDNPTNGLFIRRQGNKVTKVVIK